MTEIIMIRHGQTNSHATGPYSGRVPAGTPGRQADTARAMGHQHHAAS